MSNLPTTQQTLGALAHLAPAAPVFHGSTVAAGVLNEGISASFPILTIRGKVFRIKYRGEEAPLVIAPTVPGGQPTPRPNIDVIIVHASPSIAKIWYDGQYAEGDNEAPDCFSVNGVNPDPASPRKQSELCATCPRNVWGSKTLPSGKAGKECQDSKRLVVVPADDIANEMFGGPMLLRVPPASLQDMGKYNSDLQQFGHAFYTVRTQLGFDMTTAYPKLTWNAVRALDANEAQQVIALQTDPRVKRILSEAVDQARAEVPAQLTHAGSVPAAATTAPSQQTAPAVPAAPVAPATSAQPEYIMAAGAGFTREQFLASGWTDEQLLAAGHMAVKAPPAPAVSPTPPVPVVAPTPPAPPAAPTATPIASGGVPDQPPEFLRRQSTAPATAPAAPAVPVQAQQPAAPVAVVTPPAPAAEAFRQLTAEEMTKLTPPEMQDYLTKLTAHLAAQQAPAAPAATGRGRGRRAAAVSPPPSPAPTAPVSPVTAAPAVPTPPAAPSVPAPAAPAEAPAQGRDALAALDDKLGALLGG